MNTPRLVTLSRLVLVAGLGLASACAQAGGGVYWSVNVDAPTQGLGRIATTVSNTPRGVYMQPAPVVYGPPVVYAPAPVIVDRRPVYVQQPVVYERAPRRCAPWWAWNQHRHHDDRRYAWDDERGYDRGGERMIVPRRGDGRDDGRDDDRGGRHGH
jgi:hypothetical protein